MSKKTQINSKRDSYRLKYNDSMLSHLMSQKVISWLPKTPKDYIVVFIGTDRSTGDALGPMAGTLLKKMKPQHMNLYGTLHNPVHAQNIHDCIKKIKDHFLQPYIIAVDACLGRSHAIGELITGTGPLLPGAAVNKKLPAIGDLFLTGVVNISGYMEHAILQNTRLSTVSDMAEQIAKILFNIDHHLTFIRQSPSIVIDTLPSVRNQQELI